MSELTTRTIERAEIESGLIAILDKMTSKWGRAFADQISPQTRLGGDLELDSMQLVQLIGRIEKHFKVKKLPFHRLLLDENVGDDLRVENVVGFLDQVLNET